MLCVPSTASLRLDVDDHREIYTFLEGSRQNKIKTLSFRNGYSHDPSIRLNINYRQSVDVERY